METNTIQRLFWGSGSTPPEGWITLGREEGSGIDISGDIVLDGLPLEDASIDYMSCQHALHELEVYYLWPALLELYRVLRPGGVIRLGLIDLDKAISAYQRGQRDFFWCWDWDTISGNFITQLTSYNQTRTPLNYEFIEELLRKVGYEGIRQVAYRQTDGSFPEIIELDSRPQESFYVEALKPILRRAQEQISPGPAGQIHLSWTQDPSTSLTVVWHTRAGNSAAFLEYREGGTEAWQLIPGETRPSPGRGKLHQVTLTGLSPDTGYEYRVSGDDGALPPVSEIYPARTAPAPGPAGFCFAFLCDTGISGRPDGNATGTRQIIDEIVADQPLFILGGGDYAYANRDGRFSTTGEAVDAWFEQMQPLLARFPFMAQYGNHEIYLQERFRDWGPRFAHPQGFDQGKSYSFDVGEVHFTALFVPGPPPDAAQILWLDNDLTQARNRGMRWLIVFQHEPIFAHGHSHPARLEVRKILSPLFEKHHVNLHLSGHDQNYERTYPLIGLPEKPTPTSLAPDNYESGRGVIYVKVSPGGKLSEKGNSFSRFTSQQQPVIARRDDTAHHYALVSIQASGELAVKAYRVVGDGSPKSLLDSFHSSP